MNVTDLHCSDSSRSSFSVTVGTDDAREATDDDRCVELDRHLDLDFLVVGEPARTARLERQAECLDAVDGERGRWLDLTVLHGEGHVPPQVLDRELQLDGELEALRRLDARLETDFPGGSTIVRPSVDWVGSSEQVGDRVPTQAGSPRSGSPKIKQLSLTSDV